MMEIRKFVCNMLQENCYVVSDDTKECVIIDCGAYYPEERAALTRYIRDNGLQPRYLLATHGHLDHNFGNNTVAEEFGLKPVVSVADGSLMEHLGHQAETFYGMRLDYELPAVERFLEADESIRFGNHELKVLETPGHSPGSVTYYCEQEKVAFTGDTLFKNSIGRTDFKGGSMMQIIQSLRMLAQLPDETAVMPGHGPQTTIAEELAHNPYMDR
ncbi:MAG: MBL fold metallo-hydrolase [Prevotella sp.]